ncbi:pentapeptide repeat-containing protein [Streptomyces maoxianensis]|uniref:Pentapeptide repeat-containing protein n=1 Tax=Streptomyces maoxianensis TaxID=1459942 RepID=A0ABV9FZ48_9ACTN
MTSTGFPVPSTDPPLWPHCGLGATPENPVGCRGSQVAPDSACLTHLTESDQATYFATLAPGSDLDQRGTHLTESLLRSLLGALMDPATGRPRFGAARFEEATFADVGFGGATFSGGALFSEATFLGYAGFGEVVFSAGAEFFDTVFSTGAEFNRATFSEDAYFHGARFSGEAEFFETTFSASANFRSAMFSGEAVFFETTFSANADFSQTTFSANAAFLEATFSADAEFTSATFSADALFAGVTFPADVDFTWAKFSADAEFGQATFETALQLGPLVCQGVLRLSGARFGSPVTIKAATTLLDCRRTRWDSTAALRLRYATVDLSDAVFEYPLSITAKASPFTEVTGRAALSEAELESRDSAVRMASLRGADATHLRLHNVDLTACILSRTLNLDQLRLEGECPLSPAPSGLHRQGMRVRWWTTRRTLAEEQHWRAAQGRTEWTPAPDGIDVMGPAGLASVYRQMRKSFEDGKNEPDAADFYYGEMEMRRHDSKRPRAERALLALYWAVSGYGLRASRALSWLLGAMAATVLVMMLWGLPKDDSNPATTGRLSGQDISLTTDKPDPVNPSGALASRLTSERWEKSLRVVVNSVVFRSSGQDLTTTGTYIEMGSRLAEPVLLGLAALAIRGRIKR